MTNEDKNKNMLIGSKMVKYIDFVKKLFKKEYNIDVPLTEVSNLIADRAEKNNLF